MRLEARERRRQSTVASSTLEQRDAARQRKAARGMYILAGVFLASGLPSSINELIVSLCSGECLSAALELRVNVVAKYWIYLNSLVNPFLYAWAFPTIRVAMLQSLVPPTCRKRIDERNRRRSSAALARHSVRRQGAANKTKNCNEQVGDKSAARVESSTANPATDRTTLTTTTDNGRVVVEAPTAVKSWHEEAQQKMTLLNEEEVVALSPVVVANDDDDDESSSSRVRRDFTITYV